MQTLQNIIYLGYFGDLSSRYCQQCGSAVATHCLLKRPHYCTQREDDNEGSRDEERESGELEEHGDDSDPLYEKVVRVDSMGDEVEKDQYSHAASCHSQEPVCPSEG